MDAHEPFSIWPILTAAIAVAVSWGGAKHSISSLKDEVVENKKMILTMQEEIKNTVSGKFCRIERTDCKDERRNMHDSLEKKMDDLMSRIDLQDQKRHDHANRVQVNYVELFNKITSIETILEERSRRYRREDVQ